MTREPPFSRSDLVFEFAEASSSAAIVDISHQKRGTAAALPLHLLPSSRAAAGHPSRGPARRLSHDLHGLHANSLRGELLSLDAQHASNSGRDGGNSGDNWLVARLGGACAAIGSQLRPQGSYE